MDRERRRCLPRGIPPDALVSAFPGSSTEPFVDDQGMRPKGNVSHQIIVCLCGDFVTFV